MQLYFMIKPDLVSNGQGLNYENIYVYIYFFLLIFGFMWDCV